MSAGKNSGAREGERTRHPIRAPLPAPSPSSLVDGMPSSPGTPAVGRVEKTAPQLLKAGGLFGSYQLLHRIARSSMSEVFLAQSHSTRQLVALKCLHAHLSDEGSAFRMFEREARLAELMWHPNLVRTIESGEQNGRHYLAMEYVHGVDLRAVMKRAHARSRALPVDLVALVGLGLLAALHYAHELRSPNGKSLSVVHRDVSPQNVILTWDGEVKLLDFGIARSALQETRTDVSFVKGKIPYMSPEQCMGVAIDRRSDIFSLGSVLYELTTGRRPFRGRTDYEVMDAIVSGQLDAPSDYLDGYDPDLEAIILRSMEASPDFRYQTAREMAGALSALIDDRGLRPTPTELKEVIELLFVDRVEAWKRAQKAGKSLNDFLAHVDWDERHDDEEHVSGPRRRARQAIPDSRLKLSTSPLPGPAADPEAKTADFDRKAVAKLASYARSAAQPGQGVPEHVADRSEPSGPVESEPDLLTPVRGVRTVRPTFARPPGSVAVPVDLAGAMAVGGGVPREVAPVESGPVRGTPGRGVAIGRVGVETATATREPSGPRPQREPSGPRPQREPSRPRPTRDETPRSQPNPLVAGEPDAAILEGPRPGTAEQPVTQRPAQTPLLTLILVGTACALAIAGANYLSWKSFMSPSGPARYAVETPPPPPWKDPRVQPPVEKSPASATPAEPAAVPVAANDKPVAPAPALDNAGIDKPAIDKAAISKPAIAVAVVDSKLGVAAAPVEKSPALVAKSPAAVAKLAKSRFGRLRVKSNVPCMVSIDGTVVGRTPFTMDLAPGTHTLHLANYSRHIDHTESIRIQPRGSVHRSLRFKPR